MARRPSTTKTKKAPAFKSTETLLKSVGNLNDDEYLKVRISEGKHQTAAAKISNAYTALHTEQNDDNKGKYDLIYIGGTKKSNSAIGGLHKIVGRMGALLKIKELKGKKGMFVKFLNKHANEEGFYWNSQGDLNSSIRNLEKSERVVSDRVEWDARYDIPLNLLVTAEMLYRSVKKVKALDNKPEYQAGNSAIIKNDDIAAAEKKRASKKSKKGEKEERTPKRKRRDEDEDEDEANNDLDFDEPAKEASAEKASAEELNLGVKGDNLVNVDESESESESETKVEGVISPPPREVNKGDDQEF